MPHLNEIHLKIRERILEVIFDDAKYLLPAEYLRVFSPSAEVKGHGPGQEKLVTGKRDVNIKNIEPVGNYAIKIIFTDNHQSGIYTFDYLYELGEKHSKNWQQYESALIAAGQSR